MTRMRLSRRVLIIVAVAALIGLAIIPIASGDQPRTTGTVNVTVASGGFPFVDVEVFLQGDPGGPQWGCTDANGMVSFTATAGEDLRTATGLAESRDARCRNVEFLRSDGTETYWEAYDDVVEGGSGFGDWTPFQVTVGGTIDILITPDAAADPMDVCAGRSVTLAGTAAADYIHGDGNRNVIDAGAGDDIVYGEGGDDIICGGEGDDTLLGDVGADYLIGEAGDDTLIGGPGWDWLVGGDDADTMMGQGGPDNYIGGNGGPDRGVRRGADKCWWTEQCPIYGGFISP